MFKFNYYFNTYIYIDSTRINIEVYECIVIMEYVVLYIEEMDIDEVMDDVMEEASVKEEDEIEMEDEAAGRSKPSSWPTTEVSQTSDRPIG